MLTGIGISNFKSIKEIKELKLKPFTILAGENSSGKSNIFEAISFFAQASRLPEYTGLTPDPTTIYQYGDIINYPTIHSKDKIPLAELITYKKSKDEIITLEITFDCDQILSGLIDYILTSTDEARKFIFPPKSSPNIETIKYSYIFRLSDNVFAQKIFINNNLLIHVSQIKKDSPQIVFPEDFRGVSVKHHIKGILVKEVFSSDKRQPVLHAILDVAKTIIAHINHQASKIFYISGERGRIETRINVTTKKGSEDRTLSWVGFNGQHLIELLSSCNTRNPEQMDKIRQWGKRFGLARINAGYVKGNLESNFRDEIIGSYLNMALAGFGSKQLLSIITQIFLSEPEDVLIFEEPELSLHPKNQVLLHELFSEAISDGKQIICSTHSPFFILALSRIIKNKLLSPDDIAVYEIEKDKVGTKFKELKLNKHGFIDGGIPSFMKVEQELFNDWSDSLEPEDAKED